MEDKKIIMLACRNIEDEIDAAMKEAGTDFPVIYLPSGTHDRPERMNKLLQEIMDSITDIDYLLLPMGRCGNSTLGLRSDRFSLVLPKCEDCINLILSKDSLKVDRPKGHMFFTQGWLRSSKAAPGEFEKTLAKYGEDTCKMLMQMIYGGYTHFGILHTGLYDTEKAKAQLTPLAEMIPVEFKDMEAPFGVLKKMCALKLDDPNFVIVPPGAEVNEEM
ncbi:MAG: DUF1638 domain-containing protein, partial [Firmicutes bacterium]|nr:DUF1638 domain-containing protein [Bacillota bacterium]